MDDENYQCPFRFTGNLPKLTITFGPSDHDGSHKVWGTVLGADGQYQVLDLE